MRGYHKEEIATLNDEELDNLIKILSEEKAGRQFLKKEKLVNAFEKAWKDLEEGGIEIWFSGNEYTAEEDFKLKLNEVYFD